MQNIITPNFSDYLIFADESGDHSLTSIDKQYPIFVLAFVIIHKDEYISNLLPQIQKLKLELWGHENIIFHERDIRQKEKYFSILNNQEMNKYFLSKLADIIKITDFKIVSCIIDKNKLKSNYPQPYNPYNISLLFCMERILDYLCKYNQINKEIYINFESRGHDEDNDLKLEFLEIINNQKSWGYKKTDFCQMKFNYTFVDKKCNSIGLQLVDLIARPIGINYLNTNQNNQAYEIIKEKIWKCKNFL